MNNITLSPHFKLNEFTKSETANRLGLKNEPTAEALVNLTALCHEILEPLRKAVKKAIVINSGYRSELVNKAVGGVSNSQHKTGQACDIKCSSYADACNLATYVRALYLPYDQLIVEHSGGTYWLHVSHCADGNNRKQSFEMTKLASQ